MKVGIVSQYGNFNYGNRLQSYAVSSVLRDYGFDPEVIYIETLKKDILGRVKALNYETPVHIVRGSSPKQISNYKRQKAFERFNRHMIRTRRFPDTDSIRGYDYYVIGSDQVWKPKLLDEVHKELYFLTFAEPEQKVCFSPSFGVDHLPDDWKPFFRDKLKTFQRISVRETAGADIVEELTGIRPEVLIDPTLMLDAKDWESIARKPANVDTDQNFTLCYFLGDIPKQARGDCADITAKLNAPAYDLMNWHIPELYSCGPSEFLYLFQKAGFIQTDSFHACIFAFLFGKPFLLYAREGEDNNMFSRIETLFDTLDLMRKYTGSGLDNDLFECDYGRGYERLQHERSKVKRFLEQSFKAAAKK